MNYQWISMCFQNQNWNYMHLSLNFAPEVVAGEYKEEFMFINDVSIVIYVPQFLLYRVNTTDFAAIYVVN